MEGEVSSNFSCFVFTYSEENINAHVSFNFGEEVFCLLCRTNWLKCNHYYNFTPLSALSLIGTYSHCSGRITVDTGN